MATITHSDLAPAEAVRYSFAGAEFELDGEGASFETTDAEAIANAKAHPWLKVEFPESEDLGADYGVEHLRPEDDVLSGVNSIANDPDAVRAERERRREEAANPLAVNAALRQTEAEFAGRVAETLAAHDAVEEVVAEEPQPETPAEEPKESASERRLRKAREATQTEPPAETTTPDAGAQE